MKKFIKVLVKIVIICCISIFLFKGCLYMNQKKVESGSIECGLCKQETELIASNGEKLAFSKGNILKRTGAGAWMECSCALLISYQNDPEYPQEQIDKMDDYWQKLSDCSSDDLYYNPQMAKNYANNLSFPLKEGCYYHHEYTDGQDINVLYNPVTKSLFYLYKAD